MTGGDRLHPRPPRSARAAAVGLRRLGRHAERRPRLGPRRERLVRDAVLPGGARPRGAGRPPPPSRPRRRASPRCTSEMARAINGCAWDGLWYARCFDDAGEADRGVVRDAAPHQPDPAELVRDRRGRAPERALLAMDSAHNMLDTPYGPSLLWPPYDGGDERVNGTSTYPPGAKENGGIFCHAAAWSVIAAAQLGDGDRAYEYYRQLLPSGPSRRRSCRGRALRLLPERLRPGAPPVRPGA